LLYCYFGWELVLSCLMLAIGLDGNEVLTIEGIIQKDCTLHLIQESFLENRAVQCGFCTPCYWNGSFLESPIR
jgi:aerobic-type carbon monoxide dehydrogenase small subunit (CoxS/CutS family)